MNFGVNIFENSWIHFSFDYVICIYSAPNLLFHDAGNGLLRGWGGGGEGGGDGWGIAYSDSSYNQ